MVAKPQIQRAEPEGGLSEKQLAQRRAAGAKAREALRAKNDKPRSGWPASGMPAMGPGWGGEAKGPGAGPEALAAARAAPRRSKAERDARTEAKLDWLVALMDDPGIPAGLQLAVCCKVIDMINGPPAKRVMLPSGEIKVIRRKPRHRL